MNRWLVALIFPLLLAAAPVPLIAGAVRDQLGRPVAGATITAGSARTVTAADGTFALQSNERTVRIDCRYCAPATAAVDDEGTVTAVVRRYTALEQTVPSPEDIAAVPLSHAEQLLSLAPYAVFFDTRRDLPGPRVALYGGRSGGLVIDNGVASYDSAAGASPFRTIPAFDVAAIDLHDIQDAPRYGDFAAGGTFDITSIDSQNDATLLAGGERAARVSLASGAASAALDEFGDPFENASRADARFSESGAQYGTSVSAYSAQDTFIDASSKTLASSMSAVTATVAGPGSDHPYVQLAADRANYTQTPFFATSVWSDVAAQGGVRTDGPVSFFADAASRFSTALYSYGTYGVSQQNGTVRQSRLDAGAAAQTGIFTWQAVAAAISVDTSTAGYGVQASQHAAVVAPSVDVNAQLAPQWSVDLAAAEAIDIPSLLERYYYAVPTGLPLERIGIDRATLSFSDLHRINVGITATRENYADGQPQNSFGLSATWQIAPTISLRAWTLRFGDDMHGYTPATAWLAYRSPGGVTADLIWQRVMLDYRGNAQLGASFAVPVAANLKIFAATEARSGRRFTTIGLRIFQ